MAEELVNSWASPSFFKQGEDAEAMFARMAKAIVDLDNLSKKAEGMMSQANSIKEVVTAQNTLVDTNGKLINNYNALNGKYKEAMQLMAVQNGHSKETVQVQREIIKLKADEERAAARAAKATQAQIDAYGKLNKQYNEAKRNAQNLAVELGLTDKRTVEAAKHANELSNQLKKVDANVGVFGRNVGNYEGRINGLGFSLRNIAGELPNLGISFRTFAQSISNNIGPLSEAIAQARIQNAALAAEGKAIVPIGKQIASSIFSWQTAILALVAAFVAYAPQISDFIFNTDKAKKSQEEAKKAMEEMAKAQKELTDAQANSIGKLRSLYEITQNTTLSQKARTDAVKELQKEFPAYFANMTTESILAGQATQAYLDLTDALLAKARAQVFQSRYNDLLSKEIDLNEKLNAKRRERDALGNVGGVSTNGKGIDTFTFDGSGNESKVIAINEELRQIEQERSENGRKMQEYMGEITKNTVTQLNLTKEINKEHKTKSKAEDDGTKEMLKSVKGRYEMLSANNKAIAEDESRSLKERLNAFERYMLDEVSIAKLTGVLQGKTTNEIQAAITEVVNKFAKERTNIILREAKRQRDIEEGNLDALVEAVGNEQSQSRDDFEKQQRSKLENASAYTQSAITFAHGLADVNSQLTNRRLQEIDKEIEAINAKRDAEIESINASTLSATEKERKIADAKAIAEGKTKQLEQDKIARQRRAAQFQKGVTIADIIASTALAVIKAYTEGDPYTKVARSILAGVTGAAQLAVAIAAPLPAYEHGTQGKPHEGGPARLFEGNKMEAVIENGKVWTGDKEGIYNLSRGAEVISNKELLELSKHYTLGLPMLIPQQAYQNDNSEVVKGLTDLKSAIESKPVAQLNVTGLGMQRLTRQANSITEYINSFSC